MGGHPTLPASAQDYARVHELDPETPDLARCAVTTQPVPAQMWRGREPSPGTDVVGGEPSPGADVAESSAVPAQMWRGRAPCSPCADARREAVLTGANEDGVILR